MLMEIISLLYLSIIVGMPLGLIGYIGRILFRPHAAPFWLNQVHFRPISDGSAIQWSPIRAKDVTRMFAPIIRHPVRLRGPPPVEMWYEILPPTRNEPSNMITINYRVIWPAEIHPSPVVDKLYRVFRKFYYGSSEDIEIIQVTANLDNKIITQIKMETDSSQQPDVFLSDHAKVVLKRRGSSFEVWLNQKKIDTITLQFKGTRPIIEVLTWNHVFSIRYTNKPSELHDLPLKPVTKNLHQRYRLDRRSHFDDNHQFLQKHERKKRSPERQPPLMRLSKFILHGALLVFVTTFIGMMSLPIIGLK